MFRAGPLRELILTRLREFYREPEVVFWVYGFPVLLAIGLGIAFRSTPKREFQIGIVDREGAARVASALQAVEGLEAAILPAEAARARLVSGRIDLVVEPEDAETCRYVFDASKTEALLARERVDWAIQSAAGRADPVTTEDRLVEEPGSRYIDFLMPGLMGMNLVGGGLYGVGFVIVDMRVRKLMKRFLATPMRGSDFFLAILTSRILFMIPEMGFIFGVAALGFGVPFRGSFAALLAVIVLSAFCFAGLGLLIAARARKLETISGLINLVILPMWLLSGVFFSSERFPDFMQPVIQALPLTATNDALRAVILDGSSLASQAAELAILLAWTVGSFVLGSRLFRWT